MVLKIKVVLVQILIIGNVGALVFCTGYFLGIHRAFQAFVLEECELDRNNEVVCTVFIY